MWRNTGFVPVPRLSHTGCAKNRLGESLMPKSECLSNCVGDRSSLLAAWATPMRLPGGGGAIMARTGGARHPVINGVRYRAEPDADT